MFHHQQFLSFLQGLLRQIVGFHQFLSGRVKMFGDRPQIIPLLHDITDHARLFL